jgi:hypothetical protein
MLIGSISERLSFLLPVLFQFQQCQSASSSNEHSSHDHSILGFQTCLVLMHDSRSYALARPKKSRLPILDIRRLFTC